VVGSSPVGEPWTRGNTVPELFLLCSLPLLTAVLLWLALLSRLGHAATSPQMCPSLNSCSQRRRPGQT
jgi:hypothetical protein